jgi:hypothetical protein
MGMYLTLAALDERRRSALDHDADTVIADAIDAVHYGEDWVLDLDKQGHALAAALRAHDARAAEAVDPVELREEVGSDDGYGRARYLGPERVRELAAILFAIESSPFPQPDPDGYAPDPRLDSDDRLRRVAHACDLHGADPDHRDEMDALTALLDLVRGYYDRAAKRGDAVLVFIR